MNEIVKIWFEGNNVCGQSDNGEVRKQSLLWYSNLLNASEEQRSKYEIGLDGIHWRELDEDISFESFFYDDAEPTEVQKFFLTHPEISVKGFAEGVGLSVASMQNFIFGFEKPSEEQNNRIIDGIRHLGIDSERIATS